MKKLIFIIPVIIILGLTIAVMIFAPQNKSANQINNSSKIRIVAAENFYGDIASRIASNNAQVISIFSNPNLDPHEYEASIDDAKNIDNADIIIENGLGYDTFMDKILSTTKNKDVINVGALAGLNEEDNPHVWYNLSIMETFAARLKNELIKIDPNNQTSYETNYENFISSLDKIDAQCKNISIKFNGTQVIATERVADYILNNCGLKIIKNDFQKAIEEGNDPSIYAINFFETVLNTHQVRILVYNDQTKSEITEKEKNLAIKNNISVVGVTETMPLGTNYVDWMISQLNEINSALNK